MSSIDLTRWQLAGVVVLTLFGLLLLAGGDYVSGPVLLALVALLVTSHLQPVERSIAGSYGRSRWRLSLLQALALLAIQLVVIGVFVVAAVQHWATLDARGRVAVWALAGFAWLVYREMDRRGDEAINWLIGSRAEEEVGRRLDALRAEGWEVIHNLKKDSWGNVDHFIRSERGAYAIETKSGRFRRRDLTQALGNAAWVKEKFGERWVTAVLCTAGDQSFRPRQEGYAWVVHLDELQSWLRTRPASKGAGPASRAGRDRA
jgi:Nuclease-related domain